MSLLNVSEETAKNIVHLEIENVSEIDDLKEADRFIITAYGPGSRNISRPSKGSNSLS